MKKSFRNPRAKAGIEFWLSARKIEKLFFYLLILFIPTQFGRHFWPAFSSVYGIRVDYLSPTIYVTDILILFLFVLSITKKLFFGQKLIWKLKTFNSQFFKKNKFKTGFVLFLLIGIVLSKNQQVGIYGLVKLFEFIFFGIYVSKNITKKSFEKVLLILSVGIFFESVLAVMQFFNHGSLNGIFYLFGERYFNSQTPGIANAVLNGEVILRPYGTFSHPNVLAGYLLIATTFILINFKLATNFFQKLIFFSSLLLGSIVIFLSMSRVAIFAWFLILCIAIVRHTKKLFSQKKPESYIFVGVFLILFILLSYIFRFRFTDFRLSDESLILRETLIKSSLLMIEKNPIFGVGLNNFLTNLPYFQKTISLLLYLQPVHSIYLLIIAEIGIVGLVFFLWFIYKTYKRLLGLKLEVKESLLIVLSSVLFVGFFDHYFLTLQQGQLLLSLVLGLGWSFNKDIKT